MNKILRAWLPLGLVAVAVLALAGIGLARPAGAAVNSLSVVPRTQTVPPDTTGINVSLQADATAPGIGAYDIDVLFNNTLLRATACTSNANGLCDLLPGGKVNFTRKSAGGLTGSPLELGTITFQTGATSGFSAIAVFVNVLTDPNQADIIFPPPTISEVVISPPNDNDADGVTNAAEDACAGPGVKDIFSLRPERIDGGFAGVDDDADLLVDEALPGGTLNFDCDGDGYVGDAELRIYSAEGQDNCDGSRDEDSDGRINDGCSQIGSSAESGADCQDAVDDSPFDGFVNDGCPVFGTIGEPFAQCATAADEDSDGVVNDGCATVGMPETSLQCINVTDQDGDGRINDGCPAVIGTSLTRDQDACGTGGWPGDLVSAGVSANRLDVVDLASFVAPIRRINTSPGDSGHNVRWDLVPGSTIGETINISDLAALVSGITGFPPMLVGQKAFGQTCPSIP
jgi:hypothetical protein